MWYTQYVTDKRQCGRVRPKKRTRFAGKMEEGNLKQKQRKKAGVLLGAVLLLLGALFLYKQMPTLRRADRNRYYEAEEGTLTVFCNKERWEEKAIVQQNRYYLPLSYVASQLNSRFYRDEETAQICYVLPGGMLYVRPGEYGYRLGEEEQRMDYAPLLEQNGEWYLELEWICGYTALEYQIYTDPARIWLWNCYDTAVTYVTVEKKTSLRTLPAIKAPVVAREAKGQRFLVAEESSDWYRVIGEDGHCGYVRKSAVSEPQETVRSGAGLVKQEYPSRSLQETVVLVWDYMEDGAAGREALRERLEQMSGVNVIAPTWFTLSDNSGGFVSRADAGYVALAHENGLQVWALVENINLEVDSMAIFSSGEARRRLADGLIEAAKEYGIDGLNLDMENLNEEIALHYLQFIRELALRCDAEGLYLSVDTYVPMPYNTYYNLPEQGEIADYVILMGYDESWTEPGPNASLSFVKSAAEKGLEAVPAEKLVLGVPFYARLWSQNTDGSWNRTSVDMIRCKELLQECENAQWLEETGCYYGTVTVDGTECMLWFEEIESMRARLELLSGYKLGGVAGWRLGMEDPQVWSLINKYILS